MKDESTTATTTSTKFQRNLNHEQKADALREAAFGYCDLKKLVSEASSFRDDPRQLCGPALKKMQTLLEKCVNMLIVPTCLTYSMSIKCSCEHSLMSIFLK